MNLVYILRKELAPDKIEDTYKALSLIFTFEEHTQNDVTNAIEMRLKDFEDAVQIQTAQWVGADFIITRNVKDFMKSPVPAYTPVELIQRIEFEE